MAPRYQSLAHELMDLARLPIDDQYRSRPFFIVGAARSGTTLLRVMLDSHSDLSIGPETNVLHRWFEAASSAKTLGFFPYALDEIQRYPAAALELLLLRYTRERGKKRWGDKTPNYTPVLGQILTCWPESQVIHCVRDGRDVVCSMQQRWGWNVGAAAKRWAERVEAVLLYAERLGPERYIEVRYESLVANPERQLRRLLSFLGEVWDPEVLNYASSPHDGMTDVPEAGLAISVASVGRWKDEMSTLDLVRFRRRAGPLLERLGY